MCAPVGCLTMGSRLADGGAVASVLPLPSFSPGHMSKRVLLSITFAGALGLGTACRDAVAPESQRSPGPGATTPPAPPQTPPQVPLDVLTLNISSHGLVAVVGDSLVLSGQVSRGGAELPDSLQWSTSDSSIASVQVVEKNVVLLRALRSGTVTISVRVQAAVANPARQVGLQVFARSNRVSPIVIDEFTLLQVGTPVSSYGPMLRLRDTSAFGTTKVIGLAMDLPELGWSLFCSADQNVGGGWSAFNLPGDLNYGIAFTPRSSSRRGPPTVRTTALMSDGLAASSSATAKIEPYTGGGWYDGYDTGAQCY